MTTIRKQIDSNISLFNSIIEKYDNLQLLELLNEVSIYINNFTNGDYQYFDNPSIIDYIQDSNYIFDIDENFPEDIPSDYLLLDEITSRSFNEQLYMNIFGENDLKKQLEFIDFVLEVIEDNPQFKLDFVAIPIISFAKLTAKLSDDCDDDELSTSIKNIIELTWR